VCQQCDSCYAFAKSMRTPGFRSGHQSAWLDSKSEAERADSAGEHAELTSHSMGRDIEIQIWADRGLVVRRLTPLARGATSNHKSPEFCDNAASMRSRCWYIMADRRSPCLTIMRADDQRCPEDSVDRNLHAVHVRLAGRRLADFGSSNPRNDKCGVHIAKSTAPADCHTMGSLVLVDVHGQSGVASR